MRERIVPENDLVSSAGAAACDDASVSATSSPTPDRILGAIEDSDRFLIQQVFRPIGNEYRISIPLPGSTEEGAPILFVKQKKLTIKEDIRFRLDPDRDEHLFMIKSKTVFEFAGRHEVLDAGGALLGTLEKSFGKSLLRSHWVVREAGGQELFSAQEQSIAIALVRRFAGFLPVAGSWLLEYLPFNFVFAGPGGDAGHYRRVIGSFRDKYVLELGDGLQGADRRLVLAFAIALDALQDR